MSKTNNKTKNDESVDCTMERKDAVDYTLFERLRHRNNPYRTETSLKAGRAFRDRLPSQYVEAGQQADGGFNSFTLAAALAYADEGLHVLDGHALNASNKPTSLSGEIKVPRGSKWQERATTDPQKIVNFWRGEGKYPATAQGDVYRYARPAAMRNVNITFPEGCGLFVLDIDGDMGRDNLAKLEAEHGNLPQTWESVTGSGGLHLIFKAENLDIRNTASAIAPGVDIRGKNGQIVAPPSIHPSGNFYAWATDCAPWECQVAEAPEWLTKLAMDATKSAKDVDAKVEKSVGSIKSGSKDRVSGIGFDAHLVTIGDGDDLRGFDAPIYSAALSYFASGEDDAEALLETLRDAVRAAPAKAGRDVEARYARTDYLQGRVEQARAYISEQDDVSPSQSEDSEADQAYSTEMAPSGGDISLNIADPLGKKLPDALATLKARWAVVNVGGKVLFMPRPDPDHATGGVQFFSEAEFIKFHKNRSIVKKGKKVNPAKVFAEDAERYAEVTFAPTPVKAMRNSFNLWRGFKVDQSDTLEASCTKLKSFIKDVICGGREDVFKWLWLWMAHLAQRPGEKPGTALVIQGTGGCGKSYFGTVLTRLFAPYTVFADRAEHVTGQFNRHLATAVLLVSDEALFGGDPRISGLIKSLVTTNVQRIEAKGVDSIEVQSFLRCVFIGNPKRVVPIESNGSDRRYLCLSVADTYKDDADYFGAIEAEIAAGGLEALFAELAAYDPAADSLNWNMLRVAPETDEKKKMRRLSLPKVLRKMIEAVEDGVLELRDETGRAIRYELDESQATYVARDHMRTAVSKWADSRDGGQDAQEVLEDLFGEDVTTTRRKAVYDVRIGFDGGWECEARPRAHCYVLPSREHMQTLIEEKFAA